MAHSSLPYTLRVLLVMAGATAFLLLSLQPSQAGAIPGPNDPWIIGGKNATAIGHPFNGTFCAKQYISRNPDRFHSRWWGGKAVKRGGTWVFRTYWYYTVEARRAADRLKGRAKRRAARRAVRMYALYNETSNPSHFKSPRHCYKMDAVKFRVKGSVALAVRKANAKRGTKAQASNSNDYLHYLSVDSNGDMRDALTTLAGTEGYIEPRVVPKRIWTAPNGKLYVFWENGNGLVYTTSDGSIRCSFAEVDPSNNQTQCIEKNAQINFGSEYGPYEPGAEPVQFDSQGRVYFQAWQGDQGTLRRLDADSHKTNLVNRFQQISRWRVLGNGTVVMAGTSVGDDGFRRYWLRRISTNNDVRDLYDSDPSGPYGSWMLVYPDGNLYLGLKDRFEPDTDDLTPYDQSNYWTDVPGQIESKYLRYSFRKSVGGQSRQYGVFGSRDRGDRGSLSLAQIYPEYRVYEPSLQQVDQIAPAGDSTAILSGAKSRGGNNFETVKINLSSGEEIPLIQYSPGNKLEVYHLIYIGDNKVLFDALRFSDNQYVFGEISLQTNQYSLNESSVGRIEDLIPMGG